MSEWSFTTERLEVLGWHKATRRGLIHDLPGAVVSMLTEPVTRWLPPDWQGDYSTERAASWIAERDREASMLLVVGRDDGDALGLVLLFEEPTHEPGLIDVRLGYLLAEHAWGRGLGRELLGGLVARCRSRGDIRSLTGGVAAENAASIRILERAGFERTSAGSPGGELMYRLELASDP